LQSEFARHATDLLRLCLTITGELIGGAILKEVLKVTLKRRMGRIGPPTPGPSKTDERTPALSPLQGLIRPLGAVHLDPSRSRQPVVVALLPSR
jgi:hypothetical protein